jgi:hypothetical protein
MLFLFRIKYVIQMINTTAKKIEPINECRTTAAHTTAHPGCGLRNRRSSRVRPRCNMPCDPIFWRMRLNHTDIRLAYSS